MECIFCSIARGEIPATVVAERGAAMAFRDLTPLAPTHVLVIPRKHIASLDELGEEDVTVAADLLRLCAEVARIDGVAASGYRVVTNVGGDAGQSVFHMHLHVLGGRSLREMG